ncbi:MAG: PA2169 family four-helix-bundle protein [Brumimicrobium sp.]
MNNENAIVALNALITINNDRIIGYKTASDSTDELDLKSLFSKLILTSEKCKQQLVLEVQVLGGKTVDETKVTGKFFRVWMDVKATLSGKDRKAILNSCDYGEDNAKATYDQAILHEFEHLSAKQKTMVLAQKSLLKVDHELVKSLRSALVNL